MASIGKLVAAIAAAEGIEESTVKLIARYVREAGHISQGSYGPGAAKMTARDAANLLIAVNASALAKDASRTVDRFRSLMRSDYQSPALKKGKAAAAKSKFDDAVERSLHFGDLLDRIVEGFIPNAEGVSYFPNCQSSDRKFMWVFFERPLSAAHVRLEEAKELIDDKDRHLYGYARYSEVHDRVYFEKDAPDRRELIAVGTKTLSAVGQVLAT